MFTFSLLTLGQFSRNKFWGEAVEKAYRDPICTSTILRNSEHIILIDPGVPYEIMEKLLFNRCGLQITDITTIFLTHKHGDHFVDLLKYKHAKCYMSKIDLNDLEKSENKNEKIIASHILPSESLVISGINLIPLPGHTLGTTGLAFESQFGKTCITGDAVMNYDFFCQKEGYFNSVDFELSKESISKLQKICKFVIPGHDNFFVI